MFTQTIPATGRVHTDQRPLPQDTDYLGKGRVAACVAKRRYNLVTHDDEMQDLIQYAAATYWHRLEVLGLHPASAWTGAMHRTRRYFYRKLRGGKSEYVHETSLRYLDDPLFDSSEEPTLLGTVAAAAQEATDLQRLDWIGKEDLVTALIEGRKAAGISKRAISYALNLGTIHNEATIIRLAAQGHTNQGIATLLDTTEGTIKNRRQRIRRWLTALAEQNGVADLVEAWDKSGGDQAHAARIQGAYRGGMKPETNRPQASYSNA